LPFKTQKLVSVARVGILCSRLNEDPSKGEEYVSVIQAQERLLLFNAFPPT